MAESPSSQQHVVPSMGGGGREVNAGILENRSPPTGRMELLDWINNFLKSDYLKIEHLSDGIAYCRIFAKLFPGSVTTRKLNLKAKYSSHNLQNLAILDEAFHRLHIPRQVPMKKLANGKFQDNYEFSLWIVRYIYKDKKLLSKAQAIIYSQSTSDLGADQGGGNGRTVSSKEGEEKEKEEEGGGGDDEGGKKEEEEQEAKREHPRYQNDDRRFFVDEYDDRSCDELRVREQHLDNDSRTPTKLQGSGSYGGGVREKGASTNQKMRTDSRYTKGSSGTTTTGSSSSRSMDVNSSSNIKPGAEPVAKEGLENASQAPYYCVPPHSPSSLSSNEYQYESSRNAVLESQRHELATMMNLAEIDLQRRISDQGRTIARIQVLKAQRDGNLTLEQQQQQSPVVVLGDGHIIEKKKEEENREGGGKQKLSLSEVPTPREWEVKDGGGERKEKEETKKRNVGDGEGGVGDDGTVTKDVEAAAAYSKDKSVFDSDDNFHVNTIISPTHSDGSTKGGGGEDTRKLDNNKTIEDRSSSSSSSNPNCEDNENSSINKEVAFFDKKEKQKDGEGEHKHDGEEDDQKKRETIEDGGRKKGSIIIPTPAAPTLSTMGKEEEEEECGQEQEEEIPSPSTLESLKRTIMTAQAKSRRILSPSCDKLGLNNNNNSNYATMIRRIMTVRRTGNDDGDLVDNEEKEKQQVIEWSGKVEILAGGADVLYQNHQDDDDDDDDDDDENNGEDEDEDGDKEQGSKSSLYRDHNNTTAFLVLSSTCLVCLRRRRRRRMRRRKEKERVMMMTTIKKMVVVEEHKDNQEATVVLPAEKEEEEEEEEGGINCNEIEEKPAQAFSPTSSSSFPSPFSSTNDCFRVDLCVPYGLIACVSVSSMAKGQVALHLILDDHHYFTSAAAAGDSNNEKKKKKKKGDNDDNDDHNDFTGDDDDVVDGGSNGGSNDIQRGGVGSYYDDKVAAAAAAGGGGGGGNKRIMQKKKKKKKKDKLKHRSGIVQAAQDVVLALDPDRNISLLPRRKCMWKNSVRVYVNFIEQHLGRMHHV
eukprot:jgi/Bigna1/70127/fgenesh1_pg.11_\